MTQQLTIDQTDAATVAASPHPVALQEINVYSHSTILYWWPAWAFGFVIALLNAGQEKFLATAEGGQPSSALGLTYLSILLLLIVCTNVRLRGINSVVALLVIAFIAVLLSWFGWWDDIARLIPYLSVHMNTGFYLVFSTALLIIWLMMFFVFDRLAYWRIRPGQMTVERLIGGAAESFDTNGLRFQKLSSDFFRAALGLGAGDLKATAGGEHGATIEMPNVIFVDRKVARDREADLREAGTHLLRAQELGNRTQRPNTFADNLQAGEHRHGNQSATPTVAKAVGVLFRMELVYTPQYGGAL